MSNLSLLLEDVKEFSPFSFAQVEKYLANRHMWTDLQLKALRDNVAKLDETICVEIVSRNPPTSKFMPEIKGGVVVCNACAVIGSCLGAGCGK